MAFDAPSHDEYREDRTYLHDILLIDINHISLNDILIIVITYHLMTY